MSQNQETNAVATKAKHIEDCLALVHSLLADLDFGSITLVVQDGKVVQVEENKPKIFANLVLHK